MDFSRRLYINGKKYSDYDIKDRDKFDLQSRRNAKEEGKKAAGIGGVNCKKSLVAVIMLSVCLSIWMVPKTDAAEKTISFATEEWKDATERDGTGLYWDILRAVYESEGYGIQPIIRSYIGSVNLLKNHSVDAMIGAYVDEIENGVYPKNHFAVDIVQALYKKTSNVKWSGSQSIRGKKVAWIEGYSFEQYLPASVIVSTLIRRVDTRELGIHLLNTSKLDFFLDAEGDLKDFFRDTPEYRMNDFAMKTILELKLYVVFINSKRGENLARLFDRNFSRLLKSGTIKKLYEKYSAANFTIPSSF
ncbi:MAG: transporter substrate-binding domain-containing protein [Desulfobacter sp.]|nr:MAG: transporter substrate-binding domain-containing protein [Desulfobacter sp.]